jgi:hypothetical protein
METYEELNKQWKSTCKIVFGREVGELAKYRDWLANLNDKRFVRKSSISGIETVFTSAEFPADARFTSMDELDFNKKFEPLSIDETKDVDSILEAVNERLYYCGNIILGNSRFVEKSSNVTDSFYVYDSVKVDASKNIAYSQYLRLCENVFGTNEGGEGKFCIHCSILFKNTRCFELWNSPVCSDAYYSYGLENCNEAFFSFNAVGKNYIIGNLALPKEKYLSIKRKLLEELTERLEKEKALPSLMDIVAKSGLDYSEAMKCVGNASKEEQLGNKTAIDGSFAKTSAILFGKSLEKDEEQYADWLSRHVIVPNSVPSPLSKSKVPMSKWPGLAQLPLDRVVTYDEALKLGKTLCITENDAETIDLANVHEKIGGVAYFTPEHLVGENRNLIDCQWGSNATNCYRSVICVYSKDCGFCSWPRSSQYCFGCGIVFDSEFSMKCYDSVKLARCFEVDGGRGCTDTYFSHNVEGLQNCLFCFNTKSKRYAIGNSEIEKDRYLGIKKMVQEWIYEKLMKKKDLELSIYSLSNK